MAKNKITEYSETPNSNEDIAGITILGGSPVDNFDNAFRTIMSHIAALNSGIAYFHDTIKFADPSNETRFFRFDAGLITAGNTRVISVPDKDFTIADAADVDALPNYTVSTGAPSGGVDGDIHLLYIA